MDFLGLDLVLETLFGGGTGLIALLLAFINPLLALFAFLFGGV